MRTSILMPMAALAAAIGAAGCTRDEGGGAVSKGAGGSAPPLVATAWYNTTKAIAWKDLAGKLVLIERWATW